MTSSAEPRSAFFRSGIGRAAAFVLGVGAAPRRESCVEKGADLFTWLDFDTCHEAPESCYGGVELVQPSDCECEQVEPCVENFTMCASMFNSSCWHPTLQTYVIYECYIVITDLQYEQCGCPFV
jgi:hypothetical protein